MSNIPGMNGTELPGIISSVKLNPVRCREVFEKFLTEASYGPKMKSEDATEQELALCRTVYNAYMELERYDGKYYGKCAPVGVIVKRAMQICRGSISPDYVKIMVENVRDLYYGDTND